MQTEIETRAPHADQPISDKRNWRDIFYTSRDGLRLHARHYPAPASSRRPALCLPGLTRNARDFHALASYLSGTDHPNPRDVYAVDYRGRGRSAHDADWRNYAIQVETLDVLDFMTVAGIHDAALIGTSRGGLIAMIMATMRPASIGAVILNDIGPVIERDGLARIVAYAGRVPLPNSWAEAAALTQDMSKRHFPSVPAQQWADVARQWFDDVNGQPAHSYDQNLAKAISLLDGPVPSLWLQFEALSYAPTLAIRGELSDVLSEQTLYQMCVRHPRLETFLVAGQGHAPLLLDPATQTAIGRFLAASDRGG
ncbi:MAG: alpha/beta hydrolase [Hyphomicrobiaceae bacterium]|jgi:pimeloyl-ACP methyl ester carboxylesterase